MIQALYNFALFTILVMVGMMLLVTLMTVIYNLSKKNKKWFFKENEKWQKNIGLT